MFVKKRAKVQKIRNKLEKQEKIVENRSHENRMLILNINSSQQMTIYEITEPFNNSM